MNIKRPLLIIIPILLLILLLFFICSDRGALFRDDSTVGPVSSIDGIGQMREITPGDDMDDSAGESISSGSVTDRPAADTRERSSREVSVRKPSGTSVKRDDSAGVKPISGESIISGERETISEKSRITDTKTAAVKDDSAVREDELKDDRSEIYAAAEKKDVSEETQSADKDETLKDIKDDDSTTSVKKVETADAKSEAVQDEKRDTADLIADKPASGDVKYNRLDRIHLYSGEVLTGTVTVRGDIYTIVTPAGIRRVASKDIQGNDIVK